MKDRVVIIGGGIVGLATAYQLLIKKPGLKVLVLEKDAVPGNHQTSHNSGVIHSGIYYKPGSLKAKNCFRGYQLMIDFCQNQNIKYEICGKVIVATSELEIPQLEELWRRGHENGLENLKLLDSDELREIEPHVAGIRGISVPQTGIIQFRDVAEKLVVLIRSMGGLVQFNEKVKSLRDINDEIIIFSEKNEYKSDMVINCAGLFCDRIANSIGHNDNIRIIPFRGEYWELKKEKCNLVKNLIYPVPNPNFPFLGVHFTRMINGGIELGPNAVLAFSREGYKKSDIDLYDLWQSLSWSGFHKVAKKYWRDGASEMYRSFSKNAFAESARKLIPEIETNDLMPGGSGVRAQACDRDGKLIDDFLIVEEARFTHILNAPSPAATSSLAIGEKVAADFIKKLSNL